MDFKASFIIIPTALALLDASRSVLGGNAVSLPEMRHSRDTRVSSANRLRIAVEPPGCLSAPLPPLPVPLGHQRVEERGLEVCALPAMLPPGTDHLEPAILPPVSLDLAPAAHGSDAVSLRGVPV
jgi:hypothetical protein